MRPPPPFDEEPEGPSARGVRPDIAVGELAAVVGLRGAGRASLRRARLDPSVGQEAGAR